MKVVIQRVKDAKVVSDNNEIAKIGKGLVLLVGFEKGDDISSISQKVKKILNFRIFEDSSGKMNLSVLDIRGDIVVVPNFTLIADLSRGNRPSFDGGLALKDAEVLFDQFVECIELSNLLVGRGKFGENMVVSLSNDGPVTFCIN